MDAYDVIIIGTGAGGGTLARHLAPVRQADPADRARRLAAARDEELARAGGLRRQPLRITGHVVRPGREAVPAADPLLRRRRDEILRRGALPAARGGLRRAQPPRRLSPAWPIAYDELEPYYTKAEQLYQVHGERGEDPTEPPASAPVPVPGRSRTSRGSSSWPTTSRWPASPVPRAVRDHAGRIEHAVQSCIRCETCDGFPCLVHAKSDAEVIGVRPALEHANVTLLTNAKVVRLETNYAGHAVIAVVVERDGQTEPFAADIVVVACGAANTRQAAAASANDRHPNGLANGSDQVGRNYMFHDSPAVLAISREENPTVFQKTLGLNDFYFGDDDFDFPMGNIQLVGKSQARDVPRREAGRDEARARVDARPRRPSTRSTSGSRPRTSAARKPRHRRSRRPHELAYTATNDEAEEAAVRRAEVAAAPRHATRAT